MVEEIIVAFTPYVTGFTAGAISGFVQYWTKLKDENNDDVVNIKDFNVIKFGKTVVVGAVAGAYLSGTGLELDIVTLGVLSAGTEKVVGVIAKFFSSFFDKKELTAVFGLTA